MAARQLPKGFSKEQKSAVAEAIAGLGSPSFTVAGGLSAALRGRAIKKTIEEILPFISKRTQKEALIELFELIRGGKGFKRALPQSSRRIMRSVLEKGLSLPSPLGLKSNLLKDNLARRMRILRTLK